MYFGDVHRSEEETLDKDIKIGTTAGTRSTGRRRRRCTPDTAESTGLKITAAAEEQETKHTGEI